MQDKIECFLKDFHVNCNHKSDHKSLCLIHDTLFDIWILCGGHELFDNEGIAIERKRELYKKDLIKFDIQADTEFTEKLIMSAESFFTKLFKNRPALF